MVAHVMVGFAPRHARRHLAKRRIRRKDARRESRAQGRLVDRKPAHHLRQNAQRGTRDRKSLHVGALRVLKVAVVAARHRVQHRQGPGRQAQHLRRLGAHQLQHVGVVLLRHDRRPGAVFARQAEVGELRHGEENQVLGKARQHRHQLRERGKERRLVLAARHRRAKDVVERTRKAQQIARALAVERQRHAISRRAAQRAQIVQRVGRLEVGRLVQNHLGVARRPHAHGGRHGRLEMRAPDERHAIMRAAKVHQRRREVGHFPFQPQQLILDVQAHIHGHLVVAAAARVDLLAEIAQDLRQAQLHGHVHVLVGRLDRKRGIVHDLGQLRAHARGLVLRHHGRGHRHFGQHRHMGRRA